MTNLLLRVSGNLSSRYFLLRRTLDMTNLLLRVSGNLSSRYFLLGRTLDMTNLLLRVSGNLSSRYFLLRRTLDMTNLDFYKKRARHFSMTGSFLGPAVQVLFYFAFALERVGFFSTSGSTGLPVPRRKSASTRIRPQCSQTIIFLCVRMSNWRCGGILLKQPPQASR